MKRISLILVVMLIILSVNITAFGTEITPVNIKVNGRTVHFSWQPVIADGVTLVDVREMAAAIGLRCDWYPELESVTIMDSCSAIGVTAGNDFMTVSDLTGTSSTEYNHSQLGFMPYMIDSRLIAPVRDVVTVFGYWLNFDASTMTVNVLNTATPIPVYDENNTYLSGEDNTYFFQNQAEFSLPGHGSGYCWVCSYAMVITDLTGVRVTPRDVADVNLTRTSSGAYCYHNDIVNKFGVKFTPALRTESPYFDSYDSSYGATYIKNPNHSDAVAAAAIREALIHHPEGVMVRYAGFPHTMVAVGFSGDTIYFNDPAYTSSSSYSTTGRYQCVTFEKTCVSPRFSLGDMSYMQAIAIK